MGNFLNSLRMNNIFGGQKPIGMPDFAGEAPINPQQISQIMNLIGGGPMDNGVHPGPNIIPQPLIQPEQQQPMNYVMGAPAMTEYQKAQIALGKDRVNVSREGQGTRDANADATRLLSEQKLKDTEKLKNVTDAEKLAATNAITDKRLTAAENLLTKRNEQSDSQLDKRLAATDSGITKRGDLQSQLEDQREANREKLKQEAATIAEKKLADAATTKKVNDLTNIRDRATKTLTSLNELIDEKGNLRPEIQPGVGMSRLGGLLPKIPGTNAMTADRKIRNFLANQVLGVIGDMKSQSKTGATGFGALNMKELGVLEDAANSLDPDMDEGDFAKELGKIKRGLDLIMQPGEDESGETTTKKRMTAVELIKKHGG